MGDPVIRLLRRMNATDGIPQNDAYMDMMIRQTDRAPWSNLFEPIKPPAAPKTPAPDLSALFPPPPEPNPSAIASFLAGIELGKKMALVNQPDSRRAREQFLAYLRASRQPLPD